MGTIAVTPVKKNLTIDVSTIGTLELQVDSIKRIISDIDPDNPGGSRIVYQKKAGLRPEIWQVSESRATLKGLVTTAAGQGQQYHYFWKTGATSNDEEGNTRIGVSAGGGTMVMELYTGGAWQSETPLGSWE